MLAVVHLPQVRFFLPADSLRAALARGGRPAHYELFPLFSVLETAEANQATECHLFHDRSLPRLHFASSLLLFAVLGLVEEGVGAVFCADCDREVPAACVVAARSREPAFGDGYEYETLTFTCPNGHEALKTTYLTIDPQRMTP